MLCSAKIFQTRNSPQTDKATVRFADRQTVKCKGKQRPQKVAPQLTACVLSSNPCLKSELGNSERVCYSGDYVKMDQDGFLYSAGGRATMTKLS